MNVRGYLGTSGVIAGLFGVGFLLLPAFSLQQFAVSTQPHNLMQGRYFGALLLSVGVLFWLGRGLRDDSALRVILQAGLLGNALCAAVTLSAILTELQNQLAWGSVVIYAAFVAGNLFFLTSRDRRVQPPSD